MTFKSIDDIKKYILLHSKDAVQKTQEQAYQVINRFVKEYYSEFSPSVYERTYQLFRSLVKTDVKSTGNGWVAEVYFDLDTLDYHIKNFTKPEYYNKDKGGYEHPYKNEISPNGKFNNEGWSEMKTLEAAMAGSHGGYTDGTPIWDYSIAVLSQEMYHILKRMLNDAGIPVR